MRLTCPNCGAQYIVDDSAVPPPGRDVQCSSCGHAWFERRPADDALELEAEDLDFSDDETEPAIPAGAAVEEAAVAEPAPPRSARRRPDPAALAVLREEAERERASRRAEAAALETQPELDVSMPIAAESAEPDPLVEDVEPAPAPRRGKPHVESMDPKPSVAGATRGRSVLPDIEEINSTLRPEDPGSPEEIASEEAAKRRRLRSRGRRLGMGLAFTFFALAAVLYSQAPRVVDAVPELKEPMEQYVDAVNEARLWLDQALLRAAELSSGE